MASISSIDWTDATWNPIRGCSRVSRGCEHCYAERMAARFSGKRRMGAKGLGEGKIRDGTYAGLVERRNGRTHWTGRVELVESALDWPLRWRGSKQAKAEGRTSRIFVNSMSDLFHERVPDEWIDRIFAVMALAPQYTFQVLTKRAERMLRYLETSNEESGERRDDIAAWAFTIGGEENPRTGLMRFREEDCFIQPDRWPLPNVCLGVSVEDQETADERIPLLLQTPAAVRFVSYEPALGPVDFTALGVGPGRYLDALTLDYHDGCGTIIAGPPTGWRPLDLLIVGGESGPGARPFDLAWARSVIAQCKAAGVACFVKQLGSAPIRNVPAPCPKWPDSSIDYKVKLRDRKGGDPAEWPEELRVRQFPGGNHGHSRSASA